MTETTEKLRPASDMPSPSPNEVDETKCEGDAEEPLFQTQLAQQAPGIVIDDSSDAEAEEEEPPCKRRRLGDSAVEEWLGAAGRFRVRDLAAQPPAVRHAIVDLAALIASCRKGA